MSKTNAIGGLITLITFGMILAFLVMSIVFVFTVSPFWWIAVFGAATGLIIDAIAALIFISGGNRK